VSQVTAPARLRLMTQIRYYTCVMMALN
jgi:hypothetical protein